MVRPLDLGIFLPNAKGGAIMSTGSPPQYFPTWKLNRKNALIAENAGFRFLLSMVKWRGFGGETQHWDYSLESFSLMAACAAVTSRIQLYASVAIPTVHPAVIAKMTATIDDISQGRFGVNIVSGWNKLEYSQMGLWGGDNYFKRRYEYATEYLNILRGAVARRARQLQERFLFAGRLQILSQAVAGDSDHLRGTVRQGYRIHGKIRRFRLSRRSGRQPGRSGAAERQAAQRSRAPRPQGRGLRSAHGDRRRYRRKGQRAAGPLRRDQRQSRDGGVGEGRRPWIFRAPPTRTSRCRPSWRSRMSPVPTRRWPIISTGWPKNGIAGVCFIFPDYENDLQIVVDKVVPLMKYRHALQPEPVGA